MSFLISDWFTDGHMTYQNSTIQPQKSNITAHSQHAVYNYVTYDKSRYDHGPTGLLYKVT